MIRNLRSFVGSAVHARDGEIGKIVGFSFAEEQWQLKYFLVETGAWLEFRQVRIMPELLGDFESGDRLVADVLKCQLHGLLSSDRCRPFACINELELLSSGATARPDGPGAKPVLSCSDRSMNESSGETEGLFDFDISSDNGTVGELVDFIIDPGTWKVIYAVIDTSDELSHKKILLAPGWIDRRYRSRSSLSFSPGFPEAGTRLIQGARA